MQKLLITILMLLIAAPSWSDTWSCKQIRDVLVGPPYFIDHEETSIEFQVGVENKLISILGEGGKILFVQPKTASSRLAKLTFY